jgi:MoaA/NifB/PqqE/SkfB family radical SAM enzyme
MRFGADGDCCTKMSVYVPHWPSQAIEARLRRALRHDYVPPEQVTLAITDKCPYRCRHCSNVRAQAQPLPLSRLLHLVNEIADVGGSWLNIGGGEPSVVLDRALAVVEAAAARCETWLNTTGFALDTDKIKQLKDAGLFGGRVSLHSYRPQVHDDFVGYRGAFQIAADAIRAFRKQDIFTILSAAISESSITEEHVLNFLRLGKDNGAGFVEIIPIRPAGRAVVQCSHAELKCHRVSAEIFRKLNSDPGLTDYPAVNSATYLETPDRFGCVAGSERLYISTAGDVQPCPLVNLAVGNVMNEPLASIVERMRSLLPSPRAERLCSQLSPIIAHRVEEAGGTFDMLPVPPEMGSQILSQLPPTAMPKAWVL